MCSNAVVHLGRVFLDTTTFYHILQRGIKMIKQNELEQLASAVEEKKNSNKKL